MVGGGSLNAIPIQSGSAIWSLNLANLNIVSSIIGHTAWLMDCLYGYEFYIHELVIFFF